MFMQHFRAVWNICDFVLNYFVFQVIGANNVSVPTHFFKVIVGETEDHQLELEAYVLPNQVGYYQRV